MKRRLIKQGGGGYTIYLPKKWIDSRGLKAGDEMDITESPHGLVIESIAKPEKKEISAEVDFRNKRFLEYLITDYYRAGYDTITLKGDVNERTVSRIIRLIGGLEIVSSDAQSLKLEVMAEPFEDRKDKIMKQVFFIVKDDTSYVLDTIQKRQKIDFDRIKRNNIRMVRYVNFLMRATSKKVTELNGFYWTLINLLHWIGRRIYYLAQSIKDTKPIDISSKHLEFFLSFQKSLDLLYDGLYKNSLKSLMEIHEEYEQYKDKRTALYKDQPEYIIILMNYFNIMYRFLMYTTGAAMGMLSLEQNK